MVQFIVGADNPEIPPPYTFPGITIMSFRLPATLANLQNLCDQFLNIGSAQDRGFVYRAAASFVDMEIVTYPRMAFAGAPFNNWGFATQQEIYFRFMVWKLFSASGLQLPALTPEWTIPFIFVDNSWSMIAGRNVIGLPKMMAQFSPTPVLNANPFDITISALALKKHDPATKLDWQPIVEIKPAGGLAPAPAAGIWPWVELGAALADPILNQLLRDLLAAVPNAFGTVGLKQFRDAESLTEACYQAVVETRFEPSNFGTPTQLPAATVTVHRYDSLDIPGSLGFPANTPLQPILQYQVTMDMGASGARNLFVNR